MNNEMPNEIYCKRLTDTETFLNGVLYFDNSGTKYVHADKAVQEWQPIETAPKDGTPVLLVNKNSKHYPAIGLFSEYAVPLFRKPTWFSFHPSQRLWFEPTHWMPLPKAPLGD